MPSEADFDGFSGSRRSPRYCRFRAIIQNSTQEIGPQLKRFAQE
jgi:hypothetical protein